MTQQYPNNLFEFIEFMRNQNIPEAEYWKRIGKFLETKSRKLHIPVHGNFELTPFCNFDCKMCYIHLSNRQYDKRKLLPVSCWKQLADSARKLGMRDVQLTGGECLTYPGFDELYKYLVESKLDVFVLSNGYYFDENRIKLFEKYRPKLIQVSIYGSSEEAYEAVTGVKAFKKVYENIERIQEAGLPLKIAITPSSFMREDVEALISMAESLHVKYGVNPQLMLPRENTGRTKSDLNNDEYLRIYRFLSSIHHEELKTVERSQVPEENHGGQQRYGIRCGAGRSSFGIKHDGSLCPCLSLDDITARPLEIGFEQAWKYINDMSENYPIPLECGDCVYQKHCLSCVAVHNDAPEKGHCNPVVCERMKMLVQEGFIPLERICKH